MSVPMNSRFDKIDDKLDDLMKAFSNYRVKSETRVTKLETVQKGFIVLLKLTIGTVIASFSSVVVYLITGGD